MNNAMPIFHTPTRIANRAYIDPDIMEQWNQRVFARAEDPDTTIDVLDEIGEGFFTEGVTARFVSNRLKAIGDRPVTVNINSPGGIYFEGIAIYNMLREHSQDVTVKILGMAASAASVIAMAGNYIQIGKHAVFAIHNTQMFGGGDRHDFRAIARRLDPLDESLAEIYAARTGIDAGEIGKMLDSVTRLLGDEAVEKNFADTLLDADETGEREGQIAASIAWRKLDAHLAVTGMTRANRRKMIKNLKESQDQDGTPGAASDDADMLRAASGKLQDFIDKNAHAA